MDPVGTGNLPGGSQNLGTSKCYHLAVPPNTPAHPVSPTLGDFGRDWDVESEWFTYFLSEICMFHLQKCCENKCKKMQQNAKTLSFRVLLSFLLVLFCQKNANFNKFFSRFLFCKFHFFQLPRSGKFDRQAGRQTDRRTDKQTDSACVHIHAHLTKQGSLWRSLGN